MGAVDGDAAADTGTPGPTDGRVGDAIWDPSSDACAKLDARPKPKDSAVWFVFEPTLLRTRFVSESGTEEQTNQEVFQQLLFEAGGVAPRLQGVVKFGLAIHRPGTAEEILSGQCPVGVMVDAAWNNAGELAKTFAAYDTYHIGATWGSMNKIATVIEADTMPTNHAVLLFHSERTDSTCGLESGPAKRRAAVENLVDHGATVSTVAILRDDGQSPDVDQLNAEARMLGEELASLGGGEAFASSELTAIQQAVEDAVAEAIGCQVALDGEVEAGKECHGEVRVGGEAVPCNDPNGFRLLDPSTLELRGAACERLRNDAAAPLSARFPCDVFVPLF